MQFTVMSQAHLASLRRTRELNRELELRVADVTAQRSEIESEVAELLQRCLSLRGDERPTAQEVAAALRAAGPERSAGLEA